MGGAHGRALKTTATIPAHGVRVVLKGGSHITQSHYVWGLPYALRVPTSGGLSIVVMVKRSSFNLPYPQQ